MAYDGSKFKMIDIGKKNDTERRAVASGIFKARLETIERIRNKDLPKGDVLTLAEISGIQGAKKTSDLLPLCHPLALTSVRVWFEFKDNQIVAYCEAKTIGKTGVEMEALSGVSAALLCIYDLTKGIDPVLEFGGVQLDIKEGGKSGYWMNPNGARIQEARSFDQNWKNLNAHIVVMSDRASSGVYEDRSGPAAFQWMQNLGASVQGVKIIPDDRQIIFNFIHELLSQKNPPELILTSGGTGLSERDVTPEALLDIAKEFNGRVVPGIGEHLRSSGSRFVKSSWLSRCIGVLIKNTLIVCLPGNPKAVTEGLDALQFLIPHALEMSNNQKHKEG